MPQDQLSPQAIARADPKNIYRVFEAWPRFAEQESSLSMDVPARHFDRVVYVANGGSASAGDIIACWFLASGGMEVSVFKGYLPKVSLSRSFVLVCSTSGSTEETILLMRKLAQRKATMVAISSGGKLQQLAMELRVPHITIPIEMAPRYSLPHVLFAAIAALRSAGVVGDKKWREVREAIECMKKVAPALASNSPTSQNPAKQCAQLVASEGILPKIYGSSVTRCVAERFKTCLNENAKMNAAWDSGPELFHNEVEVWETPDRKMVPIFIRHTAEPKYERMRLDSFVDILGMKGIRSLEIWGKGKGNLAQLMTLDYTLDFATYYAAILRGVDPSSIKLIERLKSTVAGP
ncbi:MAG: SIS domain-containing protein [Nitrososphaerota archaeon]|nr:SIS domain-containing protein [Nitrososphaerota archaeon]